jgi:hypothetical protein
MVVLAIIVTITGIVLSSQSSFNKTLVLSNTAYDIALTLRSAETYGISSRASGTATNAGYGVHFQAGEPRSFTLFSDIYPAPSTDSVCHPTSDAGAPDARPGDCVYEPTYGEKVVEYVLGNGIIISNFCAFNGSWSCAQGGGLTSLDITFSRPNPDPRISTNGTYSGVSPATNMCVTVSSPQGGERFVSVGASGQIIANAPSCP